LIILKINSWFAQAIFVNMSSLRCFCVFTNVFILYKTLVTNVYAENWAVVKILQMILI